jgi:RNA polymerase sigma-70 factor (ECF subfamily)
MRSVTCAPFERTSRIAGARAKMLETDEATLVRALLDGDSEAAWAAWHRFAPKVRRAIQRRLGNEADIEDVVQQVFVCFFKRLPTLQDPEAVQAFVMSIAVNIARTEVRRNRCRRDFLRGWVGPRSSVHPNPEAREAAAHFWSIVGRLGPRDGTAFVQRFVDNEELVDVASSHGVSLSTIKRRLTRIRHRVAVQVQRDPALAAYLLASLARGSLGSTAQIDDALVGDRYA